MHNDSIFPLLKAKTQRWIFTFAVFLHVGVCVGKSIKRESVRKIEKRKRERESVKTLASIYLYTVENCIIHTTGEYKQSGMKIITLYSRSFYVYFPPVLALVRLVLQLYGTFF